MKELPDVIELVRKAGDTLVGMQPRAKIQVEKGPRDFATEADLRSEEIIIPALKNIFPGINILSEEAGGDPDKLVGFQGILDPLDGTVNYFYQDWFWSVSLAICDAQAQEGIGVIYAPRLNLLCATDGKQAFQQVNLRRQPIKVRNEDDFSRARIWVSTGTDLKNYEILIRLQEAGVQAQMRGSATVEAIQVALGNIHGCFHPCPTPYDVAAAGLIVKAAGGMVTDRKGGPWHPFCGSFVATNGKVHDAFLEIING